jgi:hypothetical protein
MDVGMAAAHQDQIPCDRYALLHPTHYARAAGFPPIPSVLAGVSGP